LHFRPILRHTRSLVFLPPHSSLCHLRIVNNRINMCTIGLADWSCGWYFQPHPNSNTLPRGRCRASATITHNAKPVLSLRSAAPWKKDCRYLLHAFDFVSIFAIREEAPVAIGVVLAIRTTPSTLIRTISKRNVHSEEKIM
jgi:hypothetical protein